MRIANIYYREARLIVVLHILIFMLAIGHMDVLYVLHVFVLLELVLHMVAVDKLQRSILTG